MYKLRSRGLASSLSKGFTLIELLVVIAIIGILSAVVLASLNTARQKGTDAAIQSDLDGIRTQAEIYYGDQSPNSYGGNTTSCTAGMFADPNIDRAIDGINDTSTAVTANCQVAGGGTIYAVSAELPGATASAGSTQYWCIDSTGISRQQTTDQTGGDCS